MCDSEMLFLDILTAHTSFAGFISESSRTLGILHRPLADFSNKSISFTNFLRVCRSERVTLVLSYSKFSGSIYLAQHIRKLSVMYGFDVKEVYEFAVENDLHLMYETASEHRKNASFENRVG